MCLQMRRYACIAERQQSDAAYHILIHAMVIHSRWQRVFIAFFVFNLFAIDVRSSSVQPFVRSAGKFLKSQGGAKGALLFV